MQFCRNICFTLNNWTDAEYESLKGLDYSYMVIGKEIGEQGTPHLQGYIEFAKKMRFTTVKKLIPRAHLEERKGTQAQAADYCKEDGDFEEFGEMKVQGHRSDLDKVRTTALEGGMRAVSTYANLQGIRIAEKFLTYNEEPRDFKPTVYWIWGKTGVGKSKRAREICGEDLYTKNDGTKWWDGYDAHENVIIDDFRPSWWNITEMLSLLDRYEKRVEFKGGWRQFKPKTIVITSALAPQDCYKNTGECVQQLLRRLDHCIHLVPDVPEVEEVILDPSTIKKQETLEDNIELTDEDIKDLLKEFEL